MTNPADYDEQYIQYVSLFNSGRYGDAHRTLTEAWQRNITDTFYKGLIQLAGAFEHWHDGSLFWAEDLLASAHNLLEKHGPTCEGLDVDALLADIRACNALVKQWRSDGKQVTPDDLPSILLDVEGLS